MIKLHVFNDVSVRQIDPGHLIDTPRGPLRVTNVRREFAEFVVEGRPPTRDAGRLVVVRVSSDGSVRLLPDFATEIEIMRDFDPDAAVWDRHETNGTQTGFSTTHNGWTISIVGPTPPKAPLPPKPEA